MQCKLSVYQSERIQEWAELSSAFNELSMEAEGRREARKETKMRQYGQCFGRGQKLRIPASVTCTYFPTSSQHFLLILLGELSAPHPGLVSLFPLVSAQFLYFFRKGSILERAWHLQQISINNNLHWYLSYIRWLLTVANKDCDIPLLVLCNSNGHWVAYDYGEKEKWVRIPVAGIWLYSLPTCNLSKDWDPRNLLSQPPASHFQSPAQGQPLVNRHLSSNYF